ESASTAEQSSNPNVASSPKPPFEKRSTRPAIQKKTSIDDYRPGELAALVRWINSDGRLRTDKEIIDEMIQELGFRRKGTRIELAIRNAIRLTHSATEKRPPN
ncbi:MAG TPA: hypothetical protein VN867_16600, partial [Candidatus Binataceae bacterium]|nr:hypothetical protein [Candidatus Binataceae bacterium]